jgi:hypothetical protein
VGEPEVPAPPDRGDRRRCLKPKAAAFMEALTMPGSPRTVPPRSRSCSSRQRPPLHRAEPPASSSPCCSPASARTAPSPVLHPSSPSASTRPRHRILGPEVSTTFPSSLWSLAFVPRREKRAKPVVSSVPYFDRCPAPRHRADPSSLDSQPSSQAGRFAGAAAVIAARAPLPCSCVVPLFDVCRRAPVCHRHPHAEHATVELRPYLSLARSCVSTNLLSCAGCRRCAIATAVPPTFCPRTPPPGWGPIFPGRTCARAPTRTRVRSLMYVPNQRRRAVPRRPPFFVTLPSARHQFRVAAMAVPSAFGTHTNARNRGAEPSFSCP